LERTLNEIVRRHNALRTTFALVENQSVQIINSYQPFTLSIVDLQPLSETERISALNRLMDTEFTQPFDLEAGLPIRFTLVRMAEANHTLLVTLHHIVSDGWSVGVFYRELTTLYQAFAEGQPSPLPELSMQYADFSMWQREWLQGERFEVQLAYWQKQLTGPLPVLELPTDRRRPPRQSFNGKEYRASLPSALLEPLKVLSREENCTLFVTLLTAFKVLLARYTQQTDILVGIPVANRARVETETMIGFFVNTLVVRSDLSKTPLFRELLKQVRRTILEVQSHQDLPYDKLVEVLQPERDVSRSPLVQVVFSLQNTSQSLVEFPDLTFQPLDIVIESAKFELFLAVSETETGLQVRLQYNTDLFDESTIVRMAEHYQSLLEGIVTNPDQSISQLPLLTEAERRQLLLVWNETQTDYPKDQPIHYLFDTQVRQTPEAVALIFGETELTYEALGRRANQLAHHLKTLGIEHGDLVGLCLDRSCEMIIAILAILKAGAAYVPLDPAYPAKRLAFMLDNTQTSVLLTQQSQLEQLPAYQGNVVCLDSDWPAIERQPQTNPSNTVISSDLAYVIYTSGSTGKPKGVEVCHRSVARLLFGVDYVRLDRHQTFLLLAPISFDASTFELWGALLHGGRCVVYPERVPTFDKLGEVIRAHKVTTLWLTASLFNAVIDEDAEILAGVSQVLTGGEALSPMHIRRALERLPQTQLVNGYGPTESTTFTCCYRIPRDLADHAQSIPIGRPIANTQVYILDKQLNPAPIGVPGELYIGGDGLARGYLNRPELTAEKFVRHPFSENPEARLYKTGDLARYRPDGNIEFMGRIDHQVKLRGFRIELGEIEAVLSAHPSVQQAVIAVREATLGNPQLVAYVVARDGRDLSMESLRAHLKQRLPEYMVPSAFVYLDALPLTPNGKFDREALPAPDRERPDLQEAYAEPRTLIEEILTEIWAELLGLQQVGIQDDFFALGGHSLLATQLISRLEAAVGITLPLSRIFEARTVAELALDITERLTQDQ
jgi:aspartate racemase